VTSRSHDERNARLTVLCLYVHIVKLDQVGIEQSFGTSSLFSINLQSRRHSSQDKVSKRRGIPSVINHIAEPEGIDTVIAAIAALCHASLVSSNLRAQV
jgi:hypothetical protein